QGSGDSRGARRIPHRTGAVGGPRLAQSAPVPAPDRGERVRSAMAGHSDAMRDAAETMRAVRELCPWSQRITHRDLVPYLIEEAHEVIDAVESGTRDELREELGDLLWQVLFHAAIAAEHTD